MIDCPQCGLETETLSEGYCEDCNSQNYNELFSHQYEFNRWDSLSNDQRENEIKKAYL